MEFDNFDLEAHLNFLCSWTNFKITKNLHSFFYLNIFFVYTKRLDGLIEKQTRRDLRELLEILSKTSCPYLGVANTGTRGFPVINSMVNGEC